MSGECDSFKLLEAVSDLVIVTDSEGFILRWSGRRELAFLPDETTEMIGEDLRVVIYPLARATLRELIGRVARTNRSLHFEYTTESTPRHDAELRIVPLEDGELAMVVSDITMRREVERTVQRTARMLTVISRAQRQFIGDFDHPRLFRRLLGDVMRLTESAHGYIGEVIGEGQVRAFSCSDGGRDVRVTTIASDTLMSAALVDRQVRVWNGGAEPPDHHGIPGLPEDVSSALCIPLESHGEIIGMVGLAERRWGYDHSVVAGLAPFISTCCHIVQAVISERQRQKAIALVERREREYRAIFDTAVAGIVCFERDFLIRSANPAFAEMLGSEVAELIGRPLNQFLQDGLAAIVEDGLLRGDQTMVCVETEAVRALADAARVPIELTVTALNIEGQLHFTAFLRDLTSQREVDRIKDEFVATVSHELRTPLTSIRGSLGLMANGVAGALPPRAEKLVDIAYRNADRLLLLINDLLDIEKIASGRMEFRQDPVGVVELLTQAIDANRSFAAQFQVDLELDNQIGHEVRFRGDAHRMMQVLYNLLSNASKFSPADGVVTVRLARRQGGLRISVIDRGPGIPEEFQPRLFERFAQADSSNTRKPGGTGLGLSIAREIVQYHGGDLTFETSPITGTTFYVDVPELAAAIAA